MKIVHITTGADGESHVEVKAPAFTERENRRTKTQAAASIAFMKREVGFTDFHPAPQRQYMLYLTARVEIGLGDGSSIVMEPGDALLAEDTTGHGHTSKVLEPGVCAVVPLT
jgi:hypothetical protein